MTSTKVDQEVQTSVQKPEPGARPEGADDTGDVLSDEEADLKMPGPSKSRGKLKEYSRVLYIIAGKGA